MAFDRLPRRPHALSRRMSCCCSSTAAVANGRRGKRQEEYWRLQTRPRKEDRSRRQLLFFAHENVPDRLLVNDDGRNYTPSRWVLLVKPKGNGGGKVRWLVHPNPDRHPSCRICIYWQLYDRTYDSQKDSRQSRTIRPAIQL